MRKSSVEEMIFTTHQLRSDRVPVSHLSATICHPRRKQTHHA
ncbi:MAG: hypothetical protein ACTS9Y_11295 [Methylophilus sp.]